MSDLIKALQIFFTYKDEQFPTICEHDVMIIVGIEEEAVTRKDALRLEELGFVWMEEYQAFGSYRFGSA